MKNRRFDRTLIPFFYLIYLLPLSLFANTPVGDYLVSVKINMLALANDNNFLLQCIIALLLVMIFGYTAKLLYEKKINKE
jgi:hypothetical protein